MRRVVILAALALAAGGCVTPVVLEDPATKKRVNCTFEAERLAYSGPAYDTGFDVPQMRRGSPPIRAFDIEQQCTGSLLREGYICVSGCKTPPLEAPAR